MPKTERREDLEAEIRLHTLIATVKYRDDRGAKFTTFLTTYLSCRCSDHLNAFYAAKRTPFSVVPLTTDARADPRRIDFEQELQGLRSNLTPYSLRVLDSALDQNAPSLRRKLGRGKAVTALQALAGGERFQVKEALSEIMLQAERHLSCI